MLQAELNPLANREDHFAMLVIIVMFDVLLRLEKTVVNLFEECISVGQLVVNGSDASRTPIVCAKRWGRPAVDHLEWRIT